MVSQAVIPQIITSEIIVISFKTLTTCQITYERQFLARQNKSWRTVPRRLHPPPTHTHVAIGVLMCQLWQLLAGAASRGQILSQWSKRSGKITICLYWLAPHTKYSVMTAPPRSRSAQPLKLLHCFIIRRVITRASHKRSKWPWSVALTQLRKPLRKSDQAIKSRSKMWNGKSSRTLPSDKID